MSKKVLIASLGDHPTVVTGMVKMLWEKKNIHLDEVVVLHTIGSNRGIKDGSELVEYILTEHHTVTSIPLNFDDPTTHQDCFLFLRTFYSTLEEFERRDYEIYVSLAGGRKNTSALMGILCQLFPSVKGLFHLINLSGEIYTASELYSLNDDKRLQVMKPDSVDLRIVSIPYKLLPNAVELRQQFAMGKGNVFYQTITQIDTEPPVQIYLSQQAQEDYSDNPETFDNYLRDMAKPEWLRANLHSKFEGKFETDCYCAKKGGVGSGSDEGRPFYYYGHDNRLVIARLTLHGSTYEKLLKKGCLWSEEHPPEISLSQFSSGDTILLVPLGESPMVATQTYTLLQNSSGDWESRKIAAVAVIYPHRNGDIANGATMLQRVFDRQKVTFEDFPIERLNDITSEEDCKIYLEAILQAIDALRTKYEDKEVVLSLSGGRKGMSALTLLAAQKAGVSWVCHTLITDPELEKKVLEETTYEKLKQWSSKKQIPWLFLDNYKDEIDKFTLFPIPVIKFEAK